MDETKHRQEYKLDKLHTRIKDLKYINGKEEENIQEIQENKDLMRDIA